MYKTIKEVLWQDDAPPLVEVAGGEYWRGLLGAECEIQDPEVAHGVSICLPQEMIRASSGEPYVLTEPTRDPGLRNIDIMYQRLRQIGIECTNGFAAVVATHVEQEAAIVMMAYTMVLAMAMMKIPSGPLTTRKLVDMFPNGLPTMEAYKNAWHEQKLVGMYQPSTNYVDNYNLWPVGPLGDADECLRKAIV